MSRDQKPPAPAEAGSVSGRRALTEALATSPGQYALFLDIDGTLLDLAATPDGIVVPDDLPQALDALRKHLGGALALVTGRALAYAEALFQPFQFPVAGLHGAERRNPDGRVEKAEITPDFLALKEELARLSSRWEGVLVEDKGAAVATHYRQAPECRNELEPIMDDAIRRLGPGWKLQRGKMVIEIRPASADKGHAVEAFLAQAPFTGRTPITIGDDVTDEAMFAVALQRSGLAVRVGDLGSHTCATMEIGSAAELRQILRELSA